MRLGSYRWTFSVPNNRLELAECRPGTQIETAVAAAQELARFFGKAPTIQFTFNDIIVTVYPGERAEDVIERYDHDRRVRNAKRTHIPGLPEFHPRHQK